ncbi:MAG: ATP synthase subunit I [Betaproteobacteria bacterium]|nr:ATP synthase subunit I [Betaproteobacteria bacterium]
MKTIVNDADRVSAQSQKVVQARDDAGFADDGLEPDFKPLTPEQAVAWRQRNPVTSPWRVLALQLLVGVAVAVLTGLVSGQFRLAASVAWGVFSVVIPGFVFARALARQMRLKQAGAALAGLFVWELVKIVLTVALLLVAPQVIAGLSWLALVAGFVVTMKVYWLAMAIKVAPGWMRRKTSA